MVRYSKLAPVAGPVAPTPNPSTFESGDFIWPKKPDVYVPYHAGASATPEQDAPQWQQERTTFLESLASQPTHFNAAGIERLKLLDYKGFYALYVGDRPPEQFEPFGIGDGVYVGHVAIVELDANGTPWVVEALYRQGVIRQSYQQWLASRPGELVWHGRVRDFDTKERARIAAESKHYIGRPYNFWNFDLDDDKDFYCSKLVWLSVFKALGFAVDGKPNPDREFWLSPKQILNADAVLPLHVPAPY